MTPPVIDRIELRRISLPLVRPFRTSFGVWTERDILLARVEGVLLQLGVLEQGVRRVLGEGGKSGLGSCIGCQVWLSGMGRDRQHVHDGAFDSLSDQEDEENDFTPHRFFLAHLLMKFKTFKWQPSIADPESGTPLLRFLRTDAEEEVQIPEIEMPTEAIVKIKEEIEGYLEQSTGQVIRL